MYLFFDTETNGLPRNYKAPASDLENWPRMVELAWQLYDTEGRLLAAADHIIRPDGFTIPDRAAAIHGISTERAIKEGIPMGDVLEEFSRQLTGTEYLVGHNVSFDIKVAGAEFLRSFGADPLAGKASLCTMKSATELCSLPGYYGFKYPTLNELHQRLFGECLQGAHNAKTDTEATARCFWQLKQHCIL